MLQEKKILKNPGYCKQSIMYNNTCIIQLSQIFSV